MIALNVDKEKWVALVKEVQEEYNIREDKKQDERSAQRIGILLGENYIRNFRTVSKVITYAPIVEKDGFDLAMEYRLTCDPLERELTAKPEARRKVLHVWGVNKISGMDHLTTQLKEWTIRALVKTSEIGKEDLENGKFGFAGNGDRGGVIEDAEIETERTRIFESRERDALRSDEQDEACLS